MARRQYTNQNGVPLPGFTTLKGNQVGWGKQQLMAWANKMGRQGKTLKQARETATIPGTIAHLMVEGYLKKQHVDLDIYDPEHVKAAEISFQNFLTWVEQFKFRPIAVEVPLVSENYQVGGTLDVVGSVLDKLALIDWKTGKTYEDLFLQFAFYHMLWDENNPDDLITGGFHCLRIPRDEDIPSFHHSHWAKLPPQAYLGAEMVIEFAKVQETLRKLL